MLSLVPRLSPLSRESLGIRLGIATQIKVVDSITVTCIHVANTVKPPKKGHIGDGLVVPCREVVLFLEAFF